MVKLLTKKILIKVQNAVYFLTKLRNVMNVLEMDVIYHLLIMNTYMQKRLVNLTVLLKIINSMIPLHLKKYVLIKMNAKKNNCGKHFINIKTVISSLFSRQLNFRFMNTITVATIFVLHVVVL